MRTDFFVAAIDTDSGERFVMLRPSDFPTKFFFPSSVEELREWLMSSTVSQDEFVVALEAMGLQPDEVSHQLERARSSQNPIKGEFIWERTTKIGFRNPQRQLVVTQNGRSWQRPVRTPLRARMRGLPLPLSARRLRSARDPLPALSKQSLTSRLFDRRVAIDADRASPMEVTGDGLQESPFATSR